MPAAAVIPAPKAYINFAAVKMLVVVRVKYSVSRKKIHKKKCFTTLSKLVCLWPENASLLTNMAHLFDG